MQAHITGEKGHRILVSDPGLRLLREYNEKGTVIWEIPTKGLSYDAWKLPDGTYLYAYNLGADRGGAVHCDFRGEILCEYAASSQIFSCHPLSDGGYLVGEINPPCLKEIAPDGTVRKTIPVKSDYPGHNSMRMCRKLPDGTYLVNQPKDAVIRQYDESGMILWEVSTPGDTFAVFPDQDGSIWYTAQKEIFRVDRAGSVLWHATREDLSPIKPAWLTGMQILQNGHLLVVNWLGHGMAGHGVPLFEIDPDKKICWTLEAPEFTDCQATIQSLNEEAAAIIARPKR